MFKKKVFFCLFVKSKSKEMRINQTKYLLLFRTLNDNVTYNIDTVNCLVCLRKTLSFGLFVMAMLG